MKCPSCGKDIDVDTAICPHCDYIIDKSFLGDGYTDQDEDTPDGDGAGRASAGGEDGTQPAGTPLDDDDLEPAGDPDEVDRELAELRRRRHVKREQPRALRISEQESSDSLEVETGRLFADVVAFLKRLWQNFLVMPRADRLVVGGAAVAFLGAFLPWVSVAGAGALTLIGIEVDGMLLVLLAAATVAAVLLRRKPNWQEQPRRQVLLYGQLGASGLATLFVFVQIMRVDSLVEFPEAARLMHTALGASVQPGAVISLLAAATMLGGSVMHFTSEKQDPRN